MKKGEIYTGIVEKLEFPSKGILHINGEKVAVKNVLPGQQIEVAITKQRKGKCEARALRTLSRSSVEYPEPLCPHAGICGGCTYQSLPYEEQLKLKEGQVKALLDAVVKDDYLFEKIKGSPLPERYRNKMEFSFGDEVKDGPLALGMHKRGGFYDIVTVDQCRLIHTDISLILKETLAYFKEHNTEFLKKQTHEGYLRHLLVRRGIKTGEILVSLVTTTQVNANDGGTKNWTGAVSEEELLGGWRDRLLALPLEGHFAGILHTKNDSLADAVMNEGTDVLYGQDFFYEELLGLTFRITPFSFFQTNSLGAEVLYETAREFTGDTAGRNVFDLYSGTGTIAQILAPVAKHVTGVEIVEEAARAAKENAAKNKLENCNFIAGDVLKVLDTLADRPDLIVLDPPRDGIHPKALPKIINYGVDRIVYVSCKPTSLVRDLIVLQAGGYKVERVCCVDMFPGTANIETVCLLSNRKPDTKVRIDVDLEDYYRIKDAKKT